MANLQEFKSFLWTSRRPLAIAAFCFSVAWYATGHLFVSLSNSLSYRVFWHSTAAADIREVHTGSYVIFNQMAPSPINREVRMIKRVGCSSGETLAVDKQDDYFCNGSYLGRAKRKSNYGKQVVPFHFVGVVPDGKLFLIGDHVDSFDSRYYGFVERVRIRGVAWPLL